MAAPSAGYDIGVSLSASSGSSTGAVQFGNVTVPGIGGGSGGSSNTSTILLVVAAILVVGWFLLRKRK